MAAQPRRPAAGAAVNTKLVDLWPTNVRTGLWCDTCHLPGRVELDLSRLDDGGVTLAYRDVSLCTECPGEGDD